VLVYFLQHCPGLFGATSVDVGSIVGGGILTLAGMAFTATGPSALASFDQHSF
jgi:basic amino acid/polyamine antiporter, APA family